MIGIPPDARVQPENEIDKKAWGRFPRWLRRNLAREQLRLMASEGDDGTLTGPSSLDWDLYSPDYMPVASGIVKLFQVSSWRGVMEQCGLRFRNATADRRVILQRFESKIRESGKEIEETRKRLADKNANTYSTDGLLISSERKQIVAVLSVDEEGRRATVVMRHYYTVR